MPSAPPKVAKALKQFLLEHKASEIGTTINNVVELESTLHPMAAAEILWKNNLVGAPVWDSKAAKYIGFFEMRDILSAVVASAKYEGEDKNNNGDEDHTTVNMNRYNEHMVKELPPVTNKNFPNINAPAAAAAAAADSTIKKNYADVYPSDKTVSYFAARNHFAFCTPDATLADLCLCLNQKNCHRVPIIGEDGKCHNIISQTALIKFIADNCPREKLQQTIQEAAIPYKKNVVSIIDTANASDAFTLLDNKRLSGIAVVDEDRKLIGNTSARDIKLAAIDEGKTAMDTDILSYLAKVRQSVPQRKERYPSCHVHEDATVAHVIELLRKTGYHRVFIVDEDIRPIGVISVTDISTYAMS